MQFLFTLQRTVKHAHVFFCHIRVRSITFEFAFAKRPACQCDTKVGCCKISIHQKLLILKKYWIFNFAVSQILKYQNSDIIDGGKKCFKYLSQNNRGRNSRRPPRPWPSMPDHLAVMPLTTATKSRPSWPCPDQGVGRRCSLQLNLQI